MFEDVADAALIDGMGEARRAESAALARRLAFVGELHERRAVEWAERGLWCTDPFEAVAAEVSAAQNISRGRAGGQIRLAIALRERLPAIAAVFATGAVDYRLVSTVANRTANVEPERMAALDAALAHHAIKWMRLSDRKLADRVDLWVARFDPAGVRVPPRVDDGRYIEVAPTCPGMAEVSGHVHADAAAVFDALLDEMAATVCPADPRTTRQRRADALEAIGARADRMACRCGSEECPAGGNTLSPVMIHLLAEQATVDGEGTAPGYLPGFGIVPAQMVDRIGSSARNKLVRMPEPAAEAGYRPSAALADFVRWRDLTCRFPGCDVRAEMCDVDHTLPYPQGPTHPSNLKLYCRAHHLLKTFYTGPTGWTDRQLPDGSVVWTAPTGHVYTTEAFGGLMFPALARSTGEFTSTTGKLTDGLGDSTMPMRERTRAEDRTARIVEERRVRAELNAERQRQAWLADRAEPPPF